MDIKQINVTSLQAPLIQPFRTALGDHNTLDNILVKLTLTNGIAGYGEAAIATHITGETAEQTWASLTGCHKFLVGKSARDYLALSSLLHEQFKNNKAALAAVETALLDALTKSFQIPLWRFFGSRCHRLATDITIVIADLRETEQSVVQFYRQGFRAFKVKIGRDEDLDVKRVLAVSRLAPKASIYLDANQGYHAVQTLNFLKTIARFGVKPQLIEQPVRREDRDGLLKVARESKVPVCADESVRSLSEAMEIIDQKAAQVINIKLMKTGIFESREIALLARSRGVQLMVGGMMETSLAMTASAHMAAGLGCFDFIDLDTPFFIREGRKSNPYLTTKGVYRLSSHHSGIGIKS